jgi:PAS domain S-box-containing protein
MHKEHEDLWRENETLRRRLRVMEQTASGYEGVKKALRESQVQLRTIVASAPIVLFAVDSSGIFTLLEGKGLQALKLRPGELVGRPVFDFSRRAPSIVDDIQRSFNGETFSGVRTINGLVFELRYAALRNPAEAIIGVIGVGIDVTEQHRTTAALREAERNYHSIYENSVEGIFQTTPEGRYLSANPALARIYGYGSTAALLDELTDIAHQLYVDPARRPAFQRLMQQHDVVLDFESQIYRRDGSVIWISENARAVRDVNGVLRYYEGTVQDITLRKQAETIMRDAHLELERRVGEHSMMVEQLGVELGDPLEDLLSTLDLAESGDPGQRRAALRRARADAERAVAALARLRQALRG